MASTGASARAADQTITFPTGAAAGAYAPADVHVDPGDAVTFNGAFANHPLVWNGGEFATQNAGMTMSFTFGAPGLHRFHCQIHASMVGSVDVAGDQLGTPDFTFAPAQPQTGQLVTFSATAFTDPDGSIARYEWDLDGDGTFEATGQTATHRYDAPGSVTAALRYVDDRNETSSATTHALTIVRGAGGGSGGTGGGAPIQPGAPGSPSSPAGGTQGAGSGDAGTKAPRLRIAARALAFHHNKASVALAAVPAGATLTATLERAGATLATGRVATARAGTKTITLKLTRAGMRALKRAHGRVRATLTVVAHARKGDAATTVRRTLSVSRRR
ncbi:hypothetical protein DSM104299_01318 [Baekduia alba]|uniref:PKD domain-containing protein n=1 Tax=Baekduia alba TaxID=2997333 RepID=UPI002340FA6B|nr:PKD domain-containing protein [Baekduia alba]WCB92621.1 hypothetical protein DSM104299_01318 [Baekduia alba]